MNCKHWKDDSIGGMPLSANSEKEKRGSKVKRTNRKTVQEANESKGVEKKEEVELLGFSSNPTAIISRKFLLIKTRRRRYVVLKEKEEEDIYDNDNDDEKIHEMKVIVDQLQVRKEWYEVAAILKAMFDRQAIWQTSHIKCELKHAHGYMFATVDSLRQLLPVIGYRFAQGPWRQSWIRYGFNPQLRTLRVLAAPLQIVDFRLNKSTASLFGVVAKSDMCHRILSRGKPRHKSNFDPSIHSHYYHN
ncbi:hypothetical protein RFI_13834 [Reticulomyxa filosa]|uniref:Transcription factor IIIC subunit 5 HTH domain-containing protein n=1 Tax=Reticulomyxa filosa TaxID=46433 RepID=X6NC40_RETFI|nr:hypothetical protein RFI_13834 [Reticulomyxa filosa]|eukprot:ETO23349.1 hypothetical protein RFI_13834 [Reticulomyxa filosa]